MAGEGRKATGGASTGSAGAPAPAGSARPRRARDSLNRSVIIDAAIRVAERDGLSGLTFQALGTELGAHATSIYRHFRDKDELLLEVIDTLRDRSYGEALVSTGDWREDVLLVAAQIRQHYLRYAPFAHDMSARSTHRRTEFLTVEFTLNALEQAGLPPEEAALHLRLLGNYIRAMASFEATVACMDPELRVKDRVHMQVDSQGLDPVEFPHLSQHASALLPLEDPRVFDLGLEAILDSIAARADGGPR